MWYKANPKLTKDIDITQSFKISIKNYNRLKERVKNVTIKIKPEHIIYYSNFAIIKEGHIKKFCKQLLQFANASLDWKLQVIPKIIGSAHSNCAKRVLSTFKSGYA